MDPIQPATAQDSVTVDQSLMFVIGDNTRLNRETSAEEGAVSDLSPKVPATVSRVRKDPALDRVRPVEASASMTKREPSLPLAAAAPEVPVTIVTGAAGMWRVQWTDAVGRLRQSWSPQRIERGTLSSLESLPPHGEDLESVLVDICIPVSTLVATLHYMNIWEVKQITYQAMRDLLASQAGAEFIALEARVQALNAK